MNKVLVTGISGYIGPYLAMRLKLMLDEAASPLKIYAVYNSHQMNFSGLNSLKCDLMNLNDLTAVYRRIDPDTVIHLASGTPTRIAGKETEYIRKFNHGVTEHLAKLTSENNALLLYTSTDLVYKSGENIIEDEAELDPLTVYSQTKLEGELAIRKFAPKHLIFRTALVYGFSISSYNSFFDTSYDILSKGETIRAFSDQFRKPIYSEDVAEIISVAPSLYLHNETINLCGEEYFSRYEICMNIADAFGFDSSLIVKGSCDEFTAYPMVKSLGLNTSKLKTFGGKTNTFSAALELSKAFKP